MHLPRTPAAHLLLQATVDKLAADVKSQNDSIADLKVRPAAAPSPGAFNVRLCLCRKLRCSQDGIWTPKSMCMWSHRPARPSCFCFCVFKFCLTA